MVWHPLAYNVWSQSVWLNTAKDRTGPQRTAKEHNKEPSINRKEVKLILNNYRPISVLPILGRTLEKLVATQLYEYCDKHIILLLEQFGFRRHSSCCEMALFAATDLWMTSVDRFICWCIARRPFQGVWYGPSSVTTLWTSWYWL